MRFTSYTFLGKLDREWAHRISQRNRVYYCSLEKALEDGYDGCVYCLPSHHR